nr:hypothetical protein [Tanacetum cinerariifolium]
EILPDDQSFELFSLDQTTWICLSKEVVQLSSIKYALTVNPNIYVSCIKQFWTTVAVKKVNDVIRLQDLVDKKKVVVTEATIREALRLDDAEGVEYLPMRKSLVIASPSRRRKGIVIRDPEEEFTTSTIIPAETKSKDKGKGIWDSNVAFLQKTKEQIEEEESRALKRLNETPTEKAAKRRNLDGKVEELKRHLQIVPNEDDDVYTEATPFARKNQRSVHGPEKVKGWKLLESCGVQIITFTTTQLILLVERKYPLTRFTLDQMLNAVRLEVEEESEIKIANVKCYCWYNIEEMAKYLMLLE